MINKLTILGSGTCLSSFYKPFDFRHPSGYLVQYADTNMLLDCSEGIRFRLDKMGFDYYSIGHIFISHFHPDHFSLDTFLQAFYVRAKKAKDRKRIVVYGPPGIEAKFSSIWSGKHEEGHYAKEFQKALDIRFIEFSDKKEFVINDKITVKSFHVPHGGLEAYSTRFVLGDRTICYSGDSGVSDNLVEAARDANFFVCEAAMKCGEIDKDNAHLNPLQAGEVAKKANTKALILTHYHGSSSDEEMLADVSRSGFAGRATVGKDFQTFSR